MLFFIQQLMVQIPSERVALHPNFDTIEVRVHFGANGCRRVQFVLAVYNSNQILLLRKYSR